jgi:hypothetical protein
MKTNQKEPPGAVGGWFRFLNSACAAWGGEESRLDGEELCAEARRAAGLKDFGDPPLEPALSVLTASLEGEAELHPLGRRLMKIHLRDLLMARLRFVERFLARNWGASRPPIRRPIFIIGMPRSGSTFLHELLALDPGLRAPRVWEVMSPSDAGGPDRGWRDLRVWKAAGCLWCFRKLAPQADAVYPMRARTPHECVAVHSHTFLSEEFISTCRIPTYETFLRSADLRPVYAWQKRFLQFLQSGRPGTRWILKSPDHVRGLEALFSVFPDALVIQTHRNPVDSLRSSVQLTEVLRQLYGRPQSREELAEEEGKNLAWSVARFIQFRDDHPEFRERFLDVNYLELISDPLAIVRQVYRHCGLPLSAATIASVEQLTRHRSTYKWHAKISQRAEVPVGTPSQLKLFGDYCRRFGISIGSADAR